MFVAAAGGLLVSVLGSPVGNLPARAQVELVEDVMDMDAHRAHRDGQSGCDLTIAVALGEQARHVPFTGRERFMHAIG